MTQPNDEVSLAKKKEIHKWNDFNVFIEVENCGEKKVTTIWVITKKETPTKALLVAKGFQEQYHCPIDPPTASKSTLQIMLPLSTMPNFSCKIITVKAAFLQSHFIDREIFLEPSEEYQSQGKLRKLNKAVYELNDPSRQWFESVKDVFYL